MSCLTSPRLMHIGMGIVCASKIKDMIAAGFQFIVFLADWHSWINNKLGGNRENIRIGGQYIKQCFSALGVTPSRVKYLWASEIAQDIKYWEKVVRVAKSASLQRVWRALPIMGREMSRTNVETAWVYYPCMQAADIFHLDLDVACAGIDQRKAHMLARDSAEKLGWKKPTCIHTHLLMGLQTPTNAEKKTFDENTDLNTQISSKMSKSIPKNCIFVHDNANDIKTKIEASYCPPKQVNGNPILEIAKYVIFAEGKNLNIPRPTKYGGSLTFESYKEVEDAYVKGEVHPLDLKQGVAEALMIILNPVRQFFHKHPQLLERMMKIETTR